jgi:hypothetical protein
MLGGLDVTDASPPAAPFRVIVAGDRRMTAEHYPFVRDWLDRILSRKMPAVTIIHGAQRGADTLGKAWAEERGLPVEAFPAAWKTHGHAAGPIRNRAMAEAAEALVCFDGGGPGSKSMLTIAREKGIAVRVVDVRHLVEVAVS